MSTYPLPQQQVTTVPLHLMSQSGKETVLQHLNIDASPLPQEQSLGQRIVGAIVWLRNEASVEPGEVMLSLLSLYWGLSMFGDPTQFQRFKMLGVLASFAPQEVIGTVATVLALLSFLAWLFRSYTLRRGVVFAMVGFYAFITGALAAVAPLAYSIGPQGIYALMGIWIFVRLGKDRRRITN